MSEPISNMDVEDVLSSIRRLVSEEAQGEETAFAPPGGKARQKPPRSGKPAGDSGDMRKRAFLRNKRESEQPSPPAAGPAKNRAQRADRSSAPQNRIGVPPSNEVTPESDDHHASANQVQKLVLTAALRVQGNAARAPDDPTRDSQALRAVITEDDTSSAGRPLRKQSSRPKPFQYSADDTLFERATKEMDALKDPADPNAPVSSPDTNDRVAPASGPKDDFSARRAEVETPDQAAYADPASDPRTADQAVKKDELDSGVAAKAEKPTVFRHRDPVEEPSTINFVEEAEPVLDEETLRDMISDMVREELQGELGDRITRNVRKLVRREIQRAMASREFE